MHRCHLIWLAAILASCSVLPSQDAGTDLPARVDAYLEVLVEMGMFSGAVLLARDGKILHQEAYGLADIAADVPNTTETRFKLMSVSKSITATAAMRLVQDGKIALGDPVAKHLPDWPETWSAVTVHDLLDHSSGIPNLIGAWSGEIARSGGRGLALWRRLAPRVADRSLEARPGKRHRYSNFQYELLGAVIEAASATSYRSLLNEKVLEPAKMTRTGFDDGSRISGLAMGYFRKRGEPDPSQQDMSRIQAAGGFYSTVGDLYRLDRALCENELLAAEVRERMYEPKVSRYACGWNRQPVHGRACIQHSGGANGYVADFLRFPDDDACVVVLSNFAFAPISRISRDLAAILFGKQTTPPRLIDAAAMDARCGVYRSRGGKRMLVVRRSGSVLTLFDLGTGRGERCGGRLLLPVGDREFAMPVGDARLRVDVRHAVLTQGGRDAQFPRTDDPVPRWRTAVGEYAAEPRLGSGVRVVGNGDRLTFAIDGGWPPELELVPVSESLALALYADCGGTLVHRDGDQLRWQRADGAEFRLRKL